MLLVSALGPKPRPEIVTIHRWCFAFESLTVILLFFFYHPPTFETKHSDDHKSKFQLLKEIDYVGLVLFSGACLILLLALNWVSLERL